MGAFDDVARIAPQQIWDGIVARAVHGDRLTLGAIELDAGVALPEHSHEQEQVGILVRGAMTFTVGGETRELGPGATWAIGANVPHSAVVGPEGAVVVEVFAPARDDWHATPPAESRPLRWP